MTLTWSSMSCKTLPSIKPCTTPRFSSVNANGSSTPCRYASVLSTKRALSQPGRCRFFSSAPVRHISIAGSTILSRMSRKPACSSSSPSLPSSEDSYTSIISRSTWAWSRIASGGETPVSSRSCTREERHVGPVRRGAELDTYEWHAQERPPLRLDGAVEYRVRKVRQPQHRQEKEVSTVSLSKPNRTYSSSVFDNNASFPIVRCIVSI